MQILTFSFCMCVNKWEWVWIVKLDRRAQEEARVSSGDACDIKAERSLLRWKAIR